MLETLKDIFVFLVPIALIVGSFIIHPVLGAMVLLVCLVTLFGGRAKD